MKQSSHEFKGISAGVEYPVIYKNGSFVLRSSSATLNIKAVFGKNVSIKHVKINGVFVK